MKVGITVKSILLIFPYSAKTYTEVLLVIRENPGITFAKVASELANRWRKLGEDKKNEFAERAKSAKNQKLRLPESKSNIFIKKKRVTVDVSIEEISCSINKVKTIE